MKTKTNKAKKVRTPEGWLIEIRTPNAPKFKVGERVRLVKAASKKGSYVFHGLSMRPQPIGSKWGHGTFHTVTRVYDVRKPNTAHLLSHGYELDDRLYVREDYVRGK